MCLRDVESWGQTSSVELHSGLFGALTPKLIFLPEEGVRSTDSYTEMLALQSIANLLLRYFKPSHKRELLGSGMIRLTFIFIDV